MEEAKQLAALLASLFDLEVGKETSTAFWAGDIFEIMKSDRRGVRGHVALQVEDVEATMQMLKQKGIEFDEASIRRDENGKISFVYSN